MATVTFIILTARPFVRHARLRYGTGANANQGRSMQDQMMAQIVGGAGFIAALDQSGGSTPGALKAYGIGEDAWSGDEQMFDLIHQMRVRIITSAAFTGQKVLAPSCSKKTMDGRRRTARFQPICGSAA